MHIVVSGWIGSTNVGDEFVFAGVRQAIATAFGDTEITALSINPERTRETHHVEAVHAHDPIAVTRAIKQADLVVFGGGGLIQHETSPFNLPYHLSRVAVAATLKTPVVGLGLGVSPLSTALAKRVIGIVKTFRGLTVRDVRSQAALAPFDIDATVACDMAWHTAAELAPPEPVVAKRPRVLLAMRPWDMSPRGTRSRLPVALAKNRHAVPYAARLTNTIDRLHAAGYDVTGLSMQVGRDDHVWEHIDASVDVITPTVDTLITEIAAHDVMVAMRYHAAVAATMARNPSVLIGYSDKVTSFAETLQRGGRHLPFSPESFSTFDRHVVDILHDPAAKTDVARARQAQLALRERNVTVLRAAVS